MKPTLLLSPGRVMLVLCTTTLFVVLLSLPVPYFRFVHDEEHLYGIIPIIEPLFELNGSANLPIWFSSTLLMITALLLAGIALARRALQRGYGHWMGLAGVFAFLSLDAVAEIHVPAGKLLVVLVQSEGVFFFSGLATALVLVMGITYFRFLRVLPSRTRNLFVLAGLVFVAGALGLQLLAGYVGELDPHYWTSARRFALTQTEEIMEKTGMLLFFYALLDYWRTHLGMVAFSAQPPGLATSEPAEALDGEPAWIG